MISMAMRLCDLSGTTLQPIHNINMLSPVTCASFSFQQSVLSALLSIPFTNDALDHYILFLL